MMLVHVNWDRSSGKYVKSEIRKWRKLEGKKFFAAGSTRDFRWPSDTGLPLGELRANETVKMIPQ